MFPCTLRGEVDLRTYVCPITLPDGAEIEEVRLSGLDFDNDGYFEGAIWRTPRTSFGPTYLSSFGGTWQSSGLTETGNGDIALFPSTDSPHAVLSDSSYSVGIGVKGAGTLFAYAVQVRYTIL